MERAEENATIVANMDTWPEIARIPPAKKGKEKEDLKEPKKGKEKDFQKDFQKAKQIKKAKVLEKEAHMGKHLYTGNVIPVGETTSRGIALKEWEKGYGPLMTSGHLKANRQK